MSKNTKHPQRQLPTIPATEGLPLIEAQIKRADELLAHRPLTREEYAKWELLTKNFLEKVFGVNSPNIAAVADVGKYGFVPIFGGESDWEAHNSGSLQVQRQKLDGLRELLLTEIQLSQGQTAKSLAEPKGHSIFLVHGHDDGVLHTTARFLEKLEQKVIVLREQPNKGLTIIEKFETYSDVGFAVVLLTADDIGRAASAPSSVTSARARQNVIFELGYFIGKLGRNRVCAMYANNVEVPSDYSGVLYVKIDDNGSWRMELAKELKAAGLPIDMNLAL
jgi:predicted nucleotide-binding protein